MEQTYSNVNPLKLHAELIESHIEIIVSTSTDNSLTVTFAEGTDMVLVQQIIDAHDPTPIPSEPSEIELLKQQLQQIQEEKNALAETLDMILVDVLPSLMP